MCEICRRTFIRRAFAFGAASASALLSTPLRAQAQVGGGSQLPARGEFTIANAYVMTMDGALGDIAAGSVHVRNGEIIAVGPPEEVRRDDRVREAYLGTATP